MNFVRFLIEFLLKAALKQVVLHPIRTLKRILKILLIIIFVLIQLKTSEPEPKLQPLPSEPQPLPPKPKHETPWLLVVPFIWLLLAFLGMPLLLIIGATFFIWLLGLLAAFFDS